MGTRLERIMAESRFAFSLTTFAPNGVVIATEKKMPTMLIEAESVQKVTKICESTGCCYSGLGPDSKALVRKGRKNAQAYYRTYLKHQPVQETVRELATVMQEYTQSGGVRPMGVSLLVAGCDEGGPALFQTDPSGAYFAWKAAAIGKNYVNARKFLEKRVTDDLDIEDAVHTCLLALKDGFDGEMSEQNIEVGVVDTTTKQFRTLSPEEVAEYLNNL